ncbi:MAG: RNA polymerase sigma factor [Candidatus Omnitrophota bacterium]|jgi:RNA polymerase sigma-70 factor (ECF subfamily)
MKRADEELILEFQNGHEGAFEDLFRKYKTPIFNFVMRLLCNRADAEDVVSEVFMKLYTHKHSYKPQARFSTWLFTIARNTSISKVRTRNRFSPLWVSDGESGTYEEIPVPDPGPLPAEHVMGQETAAVIQRAVEQLPDDQKEALILREYHNFKYDDIAAIMGCSLENVKILIYRARARLRKDLPSILMEGQDDGS